MRSLGASHSAKQKKDGIRMTAWPSFLYTVLLFFRFAHELGSRLAALVGGFVHELHAARKVEFGAFAV